MKVLIVGHACSPRKGAEPGFAWNWAWELSRRHQVWVLAHPHDRDVIDRFLDIHPNENLTFHWLDIPRFLNPWDPSLSDRGLKFHYILWLRHAYKKAIDLHEQIGFDIGHHISYSTISAPPPVWKAPFPFVWGPVGGGQRAPSSFRRYFGRAWAREVGRNTRIGLLRFSPAMGKAARASAVVLATNRDTAELLTRAGCQDVRLFLDSGIPADFCSHKQVSPSKNGEFTLLWAGRMQPRKALPLALEALAKLADVSVRLLVAGDGEMRGSWQDYARRLHVQNRVEFLGRLPWNEMSGLYQRADAFLFTSLRDSFGTQVLEAMGHGLPVLTLDHQGVRTFVPPDAGIKVPVSHPRETVSGIADGIRWLRRNPAARQKMGEAGHAYAKTQTWERRAERMSKLYEEVVARSASAVPVGLRQARRGPGRFQVLGIHISAVQISEVIEEMQLWIRDRRGSHTVAPCDMHVIVEAQHDPRFKQILNATELVVPDGMPLVWLGRRKGHHLPRRVYGPDLMLDFCEKTAGHGYRHFFYGGAPGVPERLAESLKRRFPSLEVCGAFSPPFRPLEPEEDREIMAMISRAAPDVLWVGLGAPKQERWMHEHKDKLRVPVVVSVGAAFDLLSGQRSQAPRWMREHGFEWLFRLLQEPRRLWRRYLIYGAQFIAYLVLNALRLKDFTANTKPDALAGRDVA